MAAMTGRPVRNRMDPLTPSPDALRIMGYIYSKSGSYQPSRVYRAVACLTLLHLLPVLAVAGTVYQWTDTVGITHFSDTAPPQTGHEVHAREIADLRAGSVQGLRPGEQATLRGIEQQLARQHRSARQARLRNDHAAAERRRECRKRRTRQRGTGYYATRKADTTFLRRNCW